MYQIIRYYYLYDASSVNSEVIKKGLTLEQAQEHCNREDTKGKDWFDGYTKEENY